MQRTIISCLCLLLSSGLYSCASGSAYSTPPEWVFNLEEVYPSGKFLAAKGSGKSQEAARIAASTAISRYMSTEVEDTMKGTAIMTSGEGTRETIREETFVKSQVELFALKYAAPWFNKSEGVWETVAYIDRDEAWKIYEPSVRREEQAFLDIYNGAIEETDPIRRFIMYRGAQNYYRQNFAPMRLFAERINPDTASSAFHETDFLLSELPRKVDTARNGAVIFLDCKNDYENRVTQAFEKCISAAGFRVTKNRAEAHGVLTVTIDPCESTQQFGDSTTYIFSPALQAALTSTAGTLFSYNPPNIERTAAYTEAAGRRRAYTALAAMVENSFPKEFRERLASFAAVSQSDWTVAFQTRPVLSIYHYQGVFR